MLFCALFAINITLSGQVEEPPSVVPDLPVPKSEDVTDLESLLRSVPASKKDGKPWHHRFGQHEGFIQGDRILIPFEYAGLEKTYSDCIIAHKGGGITGAIDKQNKIVLPFEYRMLEKTVAGSLMARKNVAGVGLITPNGKQLIPLDYNDVWFSRIVPSDSLLFFTGKGKQMLVKCTAPDRIAVLLESNYEEARKDNNFERTTDYFSAKKNGKWGIVKYSGQILLDFKYDRIDRVYDDQAIVMLDNKMGVANYDGTMAVPADYERIEERLSNKHYVFSHLNSSLGNVGVMDASGKVIIQPVFDRIKPMYGADFYTVHKGDQTGVQSFDGQWIVPPRFNDVYASEHTDHAPYQPGSPYVTKVARKGLYFKTINGQRQGIWHITKGEICAPMYDGFDILGKDGPLVAYDQNKFAMIDSKGKPVTPWFEGGILMAPYRSKDLLVYGSESGKYQFLSTITGKFLNQEVYEEFGEVGEMGYLYSKLNNLNALHAPDGRKLTANKYFTLNTCDRMADLMPKPAPTLPAGRTAVACAAYKAEDKVKVVVLDDLGGEH